MSESKLKHVPEPASEDLGPAPASAFYCVSDARHFLGAVALLNSLRLLDHEEPFFLVDAGLTPEQQGRIAHEATLVPAPPDVPPYFLAPFGPMAHPAGVAVVLDADIVVVRALTELVEAARRGRLVAFVNSEPNHDRFFPDWEHAVGSGPLRRQPYLAAGQMLVPDSIGHRLYEPWIQGQQRIGIATTRYGKGKLSDPFYFADMDVFNGVVAGRFERDEILMLEHKLAPHPPFGGIRLVDPARLLCQYPDGSQPFLLHHILAKPWLRATRTSIYSRLMSRLLLGPDVAIRLAPEDVPLRLREGRRAAVSRGRAHAQAVVSANTRRQLGRFGIRTRLAAWRGR